MKPSEKVTVQINEIRFESEDVLLQFTIRGLQGSVGNTTVYLRVRPEEHEAFRLDALRDSAIKILRKNSELLAKLSDEGEWISNDTFESKS